MATGRTLRIVLLISRTGNGILEHLTRRDKKHVRKQKRSSFVDPARPLQAAGASPRRVPGVRAQRMIHPCMAFGGRCGRSYSGGGYLTSRGQRKQECELHRFGIGDGVERLEWTVSRDETTSNNRWDRATLRHLIECNMCLRQPV